LWLKVGNAASDLIGLIGAILLAVPFVFGQPARDALANVEDPGAARTVNAGRALAKSAATFRQLIRERAPTEYAYGLCGALFIALSFLLKLIAVVCEAWG